MLSLAAAERSRYLPLILIGVCLLPWLVIQMQLRVQSDPVWMTEAASSILAGKSMTEAYYDTNPPMSFLAYIPAALLQRLGVPLWLAPSLWTLALMALSFLLMGMMLMKWPDLSQTRRCVLMAAFVIGTTLPGQYQFGQRDQMIAITLLPFLVAQLSITFRYKMPVWAARSALLLGTPFILLKPHYGLLPAVLLLHRLWKEKKTSSLFAFDFCCLAGGAIIYAILLFLVFPDFIKEVLPYSLKFYVSDINPKIYAATIGPGFLALNLLILAYYARPGALRSVALFLSLMSVLAMVPVLTQLKGFNYQLLPVLSLIIPSACMIFLAYADPFLERVRLKDSSLAMVLILFAAGYILFPPALFYPKHSQYRISPLARLVRGKAAGSSYFMETPSPYPLSSISAYTGIPNASRFSGLWFLPGLSQAGKKGINCLQPRMNICHIFAGYVAQDLARYKPAFVALFSKPTPSYDLLAIFRGDPDFSREWAHYRPSGEIFRYAASDYSDGTFLNDDIAYDYDIYLRTD